MIKTDKHAIIFDLDGTLLDTSLGSVNSVKHTIKVLGLKSLCIEELFAFVGPPIQESFKKHFQMNESDAQNAAEIFRQYYKNHCLFMAHAYSGIMGLLAALKLKNYTIAVATYKREDYAVTLLDKFGISRFCDSIHGADFEYQLTKSDIVELCMRDLSVSAKKSIMIGDTVHDAISAENLGIKFIGVGYGFGFKSLADIASFQHIGFVQSVDEILHIIFESEI